MKNSNFFFLGKSLKIVLVLIFSISSLTLFGQFRDSKWGMTKSQVANTENQNCAPFFEGGTRYFCGAETIIEIDFDVFYDYKNNKLYQGGYLVTFKESGDDESIIWLFKEVAKLIGEKYGRKLTVSKSTEFDKYKKEVHSFEMVTGKTKIVGKYESNPSVHPKKIMTITYSDIEHNSRKRDKDKF